MSFLTTLGDYIKAVFQQLCVVIFYGFMAANLTFLLKLIGLNSILTWISLAAFWLIIFFKEDPKLLDYTLGIIVALFVICIGGHYASNYTTRLVTDWLQSNASSKKHIVHFMGYLYHLSTSIHSIFISRCTVLLIFFAVFGGIVKCF